MKLKGLLGLNPIAILTDVADFYYWKGIPVARKWPRPPHQPGTDAQRRTWNNLREMHAIIKAAPPQWRDAWESVRGCIGVTHQDLQRKSIMWLLSRGYDIFIPQITMAEIIYYPAINQTCVFVWPKYYPAADCDKVLWKYRILNAGEPATYPWQQVGISQSRRHAITPVYHPEMGIWHDGQNHIYDAGRGYWRFGITGEQTRVALLLGNRPPGG